MRILLWHTHGRYLQSLTRLAHDFILPVSENRSSPYAGRGHSYDLPSNVSEVPVEQVSSLEIDLVICQTRSQWDTERFRILSPDQLLLPSIYLEHDPPLQSPTESIHPASGTSALLVHVTDFNDFMWNAPDVRKTVIEHGVIVPDAARYTGEIPKGIAAVNNLATRGRRIGFDVVEQVRTQAPIDVVGMGAEEAGGTGEVPPLELAAYEARYRFYLNPMRWTSLSMAVCEAMTVGMPILAPATNEIVTVVRSGIEGYVETSVDRLARHAARLVQDPDEARELGQNARNTALRRFSIDRFVADWERALATVCGARSAGSAVFTGVGS